MKEVRIKSGMLSFEDGHALKAQAVIRLGVGSLECLVSSAKGKAYVKILAAKIKGISIPEPWIQKILETVSRRQHRLGSDLRSCRSICGG